MMAIIAIIITAISALTVGFVWACAIVSSDFEKFDDDKEED